MQLFPLHPPYLTKKNSNSIQPFHFFRVQILFILFSMTLSFCTSDPVKTDLASYLNDEILRISDLEEVALAKYASVTGPNYQNDELIIKVLKKEIIPQYGQFVSMLEKIRPATKDTQTIHQVYLEGADSLYLGFKMLLKSLEKNDSILFQKANTNIQYGHQKVTQWREELMVLCKAHKVKVELR